MGGMRKLKNSRKKSLGHELDLDRWDSNREKKYIQIRGGILWTSRIGGMYINHISWKVSGKILEAMDMDNCGGPWIQR